MPDVDILHPAVRAAVQQHGLTSEVLACDPALADTAAFCAHYGFAIDSAANTILVSTKRGEPRRVVACVVLGTTRLDVNHKVSELLSEKKLSFADADTTVAVSGMEIGGVTAVGLAGMPVYVDAAVMAQPSVVMGGGNRSSKLVLAPAELLKLPTVVVVEGLANPVPAQGD